MAITTWSSAFVYELKSNVTYTGLMIAIAIILGLLDAVTSFALLDNLFFFILIVLVMMSVTKDLEVVYDGENETTIFIHAVRVIANHLMVGFALFLLHQTSYQTVKKYIDEKSSEKMSDAELRFGFVTAIALVTFILFSIMRAVITLTQLAYALSVWASQRIYWL